MTSSASAPLSTGNLAVQLDRWEDGYLVDLLGFLERLAATPLSVLVGLDPARRRNAEACLDTAVEMGLVPVARPAVGDHVRLYRDPARYVVTHVTPGAALASGFGTSLALRAHGTDRTNVVGCDLVCSVLARGSEAAELNDAERVS